MEKHATSDIMGGGRGRAAKKKKKTGQGQGNQQKEGRGGGAWLCQFRKFAFSSHPLQFPHKAAVYHGLHCAANACELLPLNKGRG